MRITEFSFRSPLRSILNAGLRRVGLELVRYSRFLALLESACRSNPDYFFIQVGANDGRTADARFFDFVLRHNCAGVVLEPLKDIFAKLVQNYRACPRVLPINLALHPSDKRRTIYRVDPHLTGLPDWAAGIASFLPLHHERSGIPTEAILAEEVECCHLMELIDRLQIRRVDLLQIDAEGFDAEIIAMVDLERVRPGIIKFEHTNLPATSILQTSQMLRDAGYIQFREGPDTIAVAKHSLSHPA